MYTVIVVASFLLLALAARAAARALGRRIDCQVAADRQDRTEHEAWLRIMKEEK